MKDVNAGSEAEPAEPAVLPPEFTQEVASPEVGGLRQTPRPPRIWPALTTLGILIPALLGASAATLMVAMMLAPPRSEVFLDPTRIAGWLQELLRQPIGLALITLPTQLILLGIALLPAMLSPTPFAERLGLVPFRVPRWLVALVVVGTIGLTLPVDLLAGLIVSEPSKHLQQLVGAIRAPAGGLAWMPYVFVGILPGCAEELFFRGYLQSRLLTRWRPLLALGLPALAFALVHTDPTHILMTLAPAAWLSWVAYRTGSVWTSILCHIANNCFGVALARSNADPTASSLEAGPLMLGALGATTLVTVISAALLWRCGCSLADYRPT